MLIGMNITVRDLNDEVFRRFKGRAAERGMKMGEAVTQAMQLFIARDAQKSKRQALKRLQERGKPTDATSKEIESLLYGE